ncbi:anti-sigma factor [Chloroflexus sp. Y-396-1]|uniref:anti-sigma factor family protein n=1 Tax=Chloroflexus sp. Y-396-1 TaxID=867845 RepID=UPI00048C21BC|nr:zf-HC2 domain-containing protein [Chloroflexus sp. Y-396-1]
MILNDHHHCEDLLDLLNDYLDGELSVAECTELEAHLRECPECQSLLASLRQTISLLHQFEETPSSLPPSLEERLIARMQHLLAERH